MNHKLYKGSIYLVNAAFLFLESFVENTSRIVTIFEEGQSMAEMRKCKECGKLFLPKGREQYCSEVHYRPCPICGEPVEVKYFSDPPRKCDACKYRKVRPLPPELAKKSKSLFNFVPQDVSAGEALKQEADWINKMEEESPGSALTWGNLFDPEVPPVVESLRFCERESGAIRMYIGKPLPNSFIPGHEYLINVEKRDYVYHVMSTQDLTSEESCDLIMPYASQISYNQNFRRLKQRGEHSGIGHNGW